MLRLLNEYSKNKTIWFLLFFSAFSLELIALYFQYNLAFKPCVLCIYQRCAIWGIVLSSLIAIVSPKQFILRVIALIIWIYCAVKGFLIAYEQAVLQFEPSLFHSCPLKVDFPRWLPLNVWLPSLFESYSICTDKVWQFLTLEMSQWMMLIFAIYFIIGLLVCIAQPLRIPKKTMWK